MSGDTTTARSLYKNSQFAKRQAIILGADQGKLYALVLEWVQKEKMPMNQDEIAKCIHSIQTVTQQNELSVPFSLSDAHMGEEHTDLMSYIIAGLADERAFDERGRITLSGVCDYVNRKQSIHTISPPCKESGEKTIRIRVKEQNDLVIKEIIKFYEQLRDGFIENIRNAVNIIELLDHPYEVHDDILKILRDDVTLALEYNYKGTLANWINKNSKSFYIRLKKEWAAYKDTNDTHELKKFLILTRLRDVVENPDTRIPQLEDLLKYEVFNMYVKTKDINQTIKFLIFSSICYVLNNFSVPQFTLEEQLTEFIKDFVNHRDIPNAIFAKEVIGQGGNDP